MRRFLLFALLCASTLAAQEGPQLPIPCWPGRLPIPTWPTPVPPHPPCLAGIQARIDGTMDLATVKRLNAEWLAAEAPIEIADVARLRGLTEAIEAAGEPAPAARYGHDGKYALPDPELTPGAINPEIVGDPSGAHRLIDGVEYNICAKGFTTKPFRKTTDAMKRQVCREYGAKDCPDTKKGEIDHDAPLEIGGLDALENLWWQTAPAYHLKDHQVEDKLKPLVCAGKITLEDAQRCILADWVKCKARVDALEAK